VVAHYNSSKNATEEIMQYVLSTSAWKFIAEIKAVQAHRKDEILDWIYYVVDNINYYCREYLSDKKDTNMQEQEYDDDSSLEELEANELDLQDCHPLVETSSVSYSDELEEESTFDLPMLMSNYASLDDLLMQGKPLGSDDQPTPNKEFYEVFPYEGSQGNLLKFIYKSLTLSLQNHKKTCLPSSVHWFSLESENLFSYVMPMHPKHVRLRPHFAMRCSKPRSEASLTLEVDIPWDLGG
jgi:hypothetical protein